MVFKSHLMNNELINNDLCFDYTSKKLRLIGLIFVKLATFMLIHSHRIVNFHNIAV